METSRESEYQSMLDYEAKKRYKEKLSTEPKILPDPYSLFEEEWIDNITKWPSIEFGDVYNYLINSTGHYTRLIKSLQVLRSVQLLCKRPCPDCLFSQVFRTEQVCHTNGKGKPQSEVCS